ncbi:SGNH/GDSL hydrolase family protein [Leptospira wolffii]|nr:SGNH/GDSL hydrolase family protein [Leptospira wolffii]TGK73844.1 SGNH/GDSL hydrolase family protein [Leptospira wolffii]TGK74999.1 SGNH/GDSL hydrolase family protein [Leptospira wolffii]TGL28706.1 SGNH/GDSL hydrolase family protein [Leptospira wolffii]
MNIIYLQKGNIPRSPFLERGRAYALIRAVLIGWFLVFLISCTQDGEGNKKLPVRPTFALFGDSISAFWPVEEQFSDFEAVKIAFPVRSTVAIQEAAKNEDNHYRACMLNGGINDFLNNFEPTQEEVDETVERQLRTIQILGSKCDYLILLNVWRVEPPWPVQAASMINIEMKQKANFLPRIDPEDLIHPEMLLDGGHLTPEGYRVLSDRVSKYLKATLPEFWLELL